jgi:hypothetical protein
MATSPSTVSPSRLQSRHVSSILAWTIIKRLCGHERGFFDEGPASLPQGPVRPSGANLEGQGVCHV